MLNVINSVSGLRRQASFARQHDCFLKVTVQSIVCACVVGVVTMRMRMTFF